MLVLTDNPVCSSIDLQDTKENAKLFYHYSTPTTGQQLTQDMQTIISSLKVTPTTLDDDEFLASCYSITASNSTIVI